MIIQTSKYLDIKASEFPTEKYYNFSGKVYLFKFKKNAIGFYTIEIWDAKNQNFLYSNQITYGVTICDSALAPFMDKIIPLNLAVLNGNSGTIDINDDTLGNKVKLYTDISEVEN